MKLLQSFICGHVFLFFFSYCFSFFLLLILKGLYQSWVRNSPLYCKILLLIRFFLIIFQFGPAIKEIIDHQLLLFSCQCSLFLLFFDLFAFLLFLLVLDVLEYIRSYDQLLEIQALYASNVELMTFKFLVEEICVHVFKVRIAFGLMIFEFLKLFIEFSSNIASPDFLDLDGSLILCEPFEQILKLEDCFLFLGIAMKLCK